MFSNHGHQNPTRQRAEQTARELHNQRRAATEPPKHIRDAWQRHDREPIFDLYNTRRGCRVNSVAYNAAMVATFVRACGPSRAGNYNVRLAK